MEAGKSRTLEVTVLSAEDLRVNGKPAKKNVFVVVRAESITSHTTAMSGGGKGGGGAGFHRWNEKLLVELTTHARCITFEVKCKTGTGLVKDVGVARIAVSDFLGGLVPDHCLQFLSYRLRDWNGLRNGIVNFSVRVVAPTSPQIYQNYPTSSNADVVIGIPSWWNNHSTPNV